MKTVIVNAKIVTATEIIQNGVCAFQDGVINYVGNQMQVGDQIIDAKNGYLIPGFVDIHCHGGIGASFMGGNVESFETVSKFHLSHGTTTILATSSTASNETIERMLITYQDYCEKYPVNTVKGVHLEGPWLNALQCGAMITELMQKPNAEQLKEWKTKYPFILRVGAAPELDEGHEFGKMGKELGVIVSPAHTDADFSEIESAKEDGYVVLTHLYSGMKGVTRVNAYRTAGAVEAGLYFDDLYVEVIADGKHLPIPLLKLIYKCKGADKICLVTDAISAAGLPNGSMVGTRIIVEDDVAKLLNRQSFAGSAATADRLYKTMAQAIGKDMVALSKMASLTPSTLMGWADRGEIAVGKRADLLIMTEDLDLDKVIFQGETVK